MVGIDGNDSKEKQSYIHVRNGVLRVWVQKESPQPSKLIIVIVMVVTRNKTNKEENHLSPTS